MGFFSNIKVAQAVAAPQENVDPQQNLQNLEGSGFLGKALANAIRSGAIQRVPAEAAFQAVQKVVEPVAAAQEATTASPAPATTSNAYTVTPQDISLGRISYRALPVSMLSRLSLASLKDILKKYEEEGEEVPRYADGGPVAGIMHATNPSLTPGGLISTSILARENPDLATSLGIKTAQEAPAPTPMTQQQLEDYIVNTGKFGGGTGNYFGAVPLASNSYLDTDNNLHVLPAAVAMTFSNTPKNPADFPAAKAPPGYRMADRSLEELGFVPQECGPMGCVSIPVVTDYANPKTGEYITLGSPFAGQLPEGWVKVNPTSYDAEGNVIGGGAPKRIYGEVDRIAPVMPAPAPTQPGSPYEIRPHSVQIGQTRTSYIPDSIMRNLSGRSVEGLYQQYGQDQSAENARMMPANDLLEFLRKNRMV